MARGDLIVCCVRIHEAGIPDDEPATFGAVTVVEIGNQTGCSSASRTGVGVRIVRWIWPTMRATEVATAATTDHFVAAIASDCRFIVFIRFDRKEPVRPLRSLRGSLHRSGSRCLAPLYDANRT